METDVLKQADDLLPHSECCNVLCNVWLWSNCYI